MTFNSRSFKTDAIILRRSEFRESDYLVTVFTPNYGKLRAMVRGARKPTTRKTGQVELFTRAHLVLSGSGDLQNISQAETVEHFLPIQEDLSRNLLASHFVEMLDQFSYEGESNPRAFNLLLAGLGWLCEAEADLQLAARYYEFRLLRVMGYEPSLFECVVSGETLTAEDQFFSVAEGGVVLPAYTAGLDVMRLSLPVFKILRHFSRQPWEAVRGLNLSTEHAKELERLLHTYLTYLLERRLNSAQMLEKLDREHPHD
jgi:DNA repair protein RecO (recombination protein O)